MRYKVAATVMSLGLAACGNGDSGGAPSGTDTANAAVSPPTPKPEVVVRVSGAHSGTFGSTGSLFCTPDEFGGPEEGLQLYAMKMPEQFNLKLPRRTEPGTYSITGGAGAPLKFYYTDPQGVKYEQIESATIALDAVPQAQGERLIGTIQATLKSRKGQSVNVDVQLDLDAATQSFDECQ